MPTQRVIHHGLSSVMLPDSGRQLAAAGTPGSVRDDLELSEADRRFLGDAVTVVDLDDEPAPPAGSTAPAAEIPATVTRPRPRARG